MVNSGEPHELTLARFSYQGCSSMIRVKLMSQGVPPLSILVDAECVIPYKIVVDYYSLIILY